jgi:hypothetical protein
MMANYLEHSVPSPTIKSELQELRTLRNLHIKYLKMIRYAIEHRRDKQIGVDYEEVYNSQCIEDILALLDEHDNEVGRVKI